MRAELKGKCINGNLFTSALVAGRFILPARSFHLASLMIFVLSDQGSAHQNNGLFHRRLWPLLHVFVEYYKMNKFKLLQENSANDHVHFFISRLISPALLRVGRINSI